MNETEQELKELMNKNNNAWNFANGEMRMNDSLIREIYAMKHEVDPLRDKNGMPIPGTGRLITLEEKKLVMKYIVEKGYPFTNKVYNVVLKGYLNGDIDLGIEKAQKL